MGSLFSIKCTDYSAAVISDEHIMRFPPNMGLTGEAITKRQPVVSLEGEDDDKFSFDVDNIH
jgi:hypothetical protein